MQRIGTLEHDILHRHTWPRGFRKSMSLSQTASCCISCVMTISLTDVPTRSCFGGQQLGRLLVEYIPSSNYDALLAPTVVKNELVQLPAVAAEPLELVVEMAPLSVVAVTISSL